jgi:hypothetical protein
MGSAIAIPAVDCATGTDFGGVLLSSFFAHPVDTVIPVAAIAKSALRRVMAFLSLVSWTIFGRLLR